VHNSLLQSVARYYKRMSQTLFAPPQNRRANPKSWDSSLAGSGKSLNIPFVSDRQTPVSLSSSLKPVRFAHGSGREWG